MRKRFSFAELASGSAESDLRKASAAASGDLRDDGELGFTLIEALVALAIVAAGLAAIGELGFSTLSAAHRAETRLSLAAAARKIYASLLDQRALRDGAQGREPEGALWRVRASPFAFDAPGAPGPVIWAPQAVRLTVASPTGAQIVIDTVKLKPVGGGS